MGNSISSMIQRLANKVQLMISCVEMEQYDRARLEASSVIILTHQISAFVGGLMVAIAADDKLTAMANDVALIPVEPVLQKGVGEVVPIADIPVIANAKKIVVVPRTRQAKDVKNEES